MYSELHTSGVSARIRVSRSHPDGGERQPADGPAPVASGAADDPAGPDRSGHHARREGQEQQPRVHRRDAGHHLQVERQEDYAAEQAAPGKEAERRADREDRVAEQAQRKDRLGDPRFPCHEGAEQHAPAGDQTDDDRRRPRILGAAPDQRQQQAAHARHQQERTLHVDAMRAPDQRQVQDAGGDGKRHRADRQVDQKDPAPRQVVDDESADERADDAGKRPGSGEQPDVAPAFARRYDVAHHGEREGHQTARADALHGPKQDELNHPLGDARQQRPRQEDQDRGLEHDPPPVQIADLAVQRRADGRAEQVRRDHPGVVVEAAQLTDNARQRRGDNRLVERRQQQPGHEAGED